MRLDGPYQLRAQRWLGVKQNKHKKLLNSLLSKRILIAIYFYSSKCCWNRTIRGTTVQLSNGEVYL